MGQNLKIRVAQADDVADVLKIHKQFRKYLGPLPDEAFHDGVSERSLIVATENSAVVGYLLYYRRRRSSDVRITHLAVNRSSGRAGVGRALVTELESTERHLDRIRLKCARGFPAEKFWKSVGFVAVSEAPGRSLSRSLLTTFEKSLSTQPTLWDAEHLAASRVPVAVDLNILLDLALERKGTQHLLERLQDLGYEPVCTPALLNELNDHDDDRERADALLIAQQWRYVREQAAEETVQRLASEVQGAELSDIRHLADAEANELSLLLSRDSKFRSAAAKCVSARSCDVLSPSIALHEARLKDEPEVLQSRLIDFQLRSRKFEIEEHLGLFVNHGEGESKRGLRAKIEALAADETTKLEYLSLKGAPIASWAYRETSSGVEVPLARLRHGTGQRALADHVITHLRETAVKIAPPGTVSKVTLTDRNAGHFIRQEFESAGELNANDQPEIVCLRGCFDLNSARKLLDESDIPLQFGRASATTSPSGVADSQTSRIERDFAPMFLTGTPLDTWIVPITAANADRLIGPGLQGTLLGRTQSILTRREHVYFRAGDGLSISAPARIFWYRSKESKLIYATSHVRKVLAGEPDRIWGEFKDHGIYTKSEVRDAASERSRRVMAIKFAQTRILSQPLEIDTVAEIARSKGLPSPNVLRKPTRVHPTLADEILIRSTD